MIAYPNPKDPDDWRFLFMQRGTRGTPLYRGRFHVVPSFMFQPCDVTGFDPNSLYYNILREFGEEVLDLDEERIRKEPNYLPAQPIFKDFRDDLDSGRIGIIYTGTTMNLLDLRPDICSVLVFTDYQLYEKRHGDWKITLTEFDPTEIGKQSGEKQRRYKYFSLKKAESDFVDLFPPHNITPPGAGAMWLAIQYLKDKRPEDIRELLQRKSIV